MFIYRHQISRCERHGILGKSSVCSFSVIGGDLITTQRIGKRKKQIGYDEPSNTYEHNIIYYYENIIDLIETSIKYYVNSNLNFFLKPHHYKNYFEIFLKLKTRDIQIPRNYILFYNIVCSVCMNESENNPGMNNNVTNNHN